VAIDFDGSKSSDDDGTIATYAWDFGDGNNGTGITASHTYATTGTFPVTLTVTDDDSDTDTQQTTAYVASGDVAPEAEAGGPYTGAANAAVDFDGSGSSDDSMIETYAWEFGDDNSGAGVMPSNTYAAAGIYISSLTVTDDDNLIDSDGTLALIGLAPQPPQAESNGPFVASVGSLVKFDAGESSDLDGDIVSYAWDFGDGNNGTGESTQHAYAAHGIYPVTLTVTDNDDNSDEENTAAFIGSGNLAPTADAGAPVAGTAGVAVDFDGSASDDPDGIITTYAWDFGDNTTGSGRSPAHVYSHAGIYNVTLTVTDNDGSSDSDGSFAVVGFSSAPDVGCRDSGKQSLSLKTKKGKFDWKWKKGAATTKADFGDPLTATNYQVCLFDSVDDSLEPDFCVLVPAGADWKEQKKGFKFKSKTGVEGITKIQLKEGKSGKAKITVKGKDMVLPALPLSQDPEVAVQIRNSAGVCWESRVSTAKKNDEKKFKAK
jgi:PKD repeat protein